MKICNSEANPLLAPVARPAFPQAFSAPEVPRGYLAQAAQDVGSVRSAEAGEQAYVDTMSALYSWMLDGLEEPRRGPQARQVILETLARLSRLEFRDPSLQILDVKPSLIYWTKFAANPDMRDEQLTGIAAVKIESLQRTPEEIARIKGQFPNYAELPSHKMAVALLSGITGIPAQELSDKCPDLGLSGTPDTRLWVPGEGCLEFGTPGEYQLANALHDTTDFLDQAGVPFVNWAVWGEASSFGSALVSVASAWWGNDYLG